MANPRNGKPLLGGGGGQQRPGSAEQDFFQLSAVQLSQQIPAQCDGAAPAAGASRVDILLGVVEYQSAAVRQFAP